MISTSKTVQVISDRIIEPHRMAQNLDVFEFTLTDDEMARIAAMDTGATLFFDHRDAAMVSAIGTAPSTTDDPPAARPASVCQPGRGRHLNADPGSSITAAAGFHGLANAA
jgi:hypothetical protein